MKHEFGSRGGDQTTRPGSGLDSEPARLRRGERLRTLDYAVRVYGEGVQNGLLMGSTTLLAVAGAAIVGPALGMGTLEGALATAGTATAANGTGAFLAGSLGGAGLGKLAGRSINVSQRGLDIVERHLAQFGHVPQNAAMVARLQGAMQSGTRVAGADASAPHVRFAQASGGGCG
jgi:hypothetical protein